MATDQQARLEILTRIDKALRDFKRLQAGAVGSLDEIEEAADEAGEELDELGNFADTAKKAFVALGAVFAAGQLKDFAKAALEAADSFQILTDRLGAPDFAFVQAEANRLGLELLSLSNSFADFVASVEGTKLAGEAARVTFSGFAEALSDAGRSVAEIDSALEKVAELARKGAVSFDDLSGELGRVLPQAVQVAADAFGVTREELRRLLATGELTAEQLLPALAKGLAELEDPARRASEAVQTLQNVLLQSKAAFGAAFTGELTKGLDDFSAKGDDAVVVARALGQAIGFVASTAKNLAVVIAGSFGVALAKVQRLAFGLAEALAKVQLKLFELLPGFKATEERLRSTLDDIEALQAGAERFGEASAEDIASGIEGLKNQFRGLGEAAQEAKPPIEDLAPPLEDLPPKLEELGDKADKAGEKLKTGVAAGATAAKESLIDLTTVAREAGDAVAEAAQAAIDGVEQARSEARKQDQATKQTSKVQDDATQNVEDLRKEVEQLTDAQQTNLIVTEDQFTTLAVKTEELAVAESSLADSRVENDQVFFQQQQQQVAGQEDLNDLFSEAQSQIDKVTDSFGEQGDVATSSLQSIKDSFQNVTDQIGVSDDSVAEFAENFQTELDRLGQVGGEKLQQLADDFEKSSEGGDKLGESLKDAADAAEEAGKKGAEGMKLLRQEVEETTKACRELAECLQSVSGIE